MYACICFLQPSGKLVSITGNGQVKLTCLGDCPLGYNTFGSISTYPLPETDPNRQG